MRPHPCLPEHCPATLNAARRAAAASRTRPSRGPGAALTSGSIALACLAWLALLAACFALPARAAGLGELIVHSALGQPLEARVEITGLRGKEFESLTVSSATPELFKQRGLNYTALARNLRYTPTKREDGSAYLRITSVAPVNEPSVDMLIDFAWPGGRLLQKYSLLLDLPVR